MKYVRIKYKSKIRLVVLLTFSIWFISLKDIKAIILGCLFMVVAFIMIFLIKDETKADIYKDKVVMYVGNEIVSLDADSISEWNTDKATISIISKNGNIYFVETQQILKANLILKKYFPKKESMELASSKKKRE